MSVLTEVDLCLELEVIIELFADHQIKVEIESLQSRDHVPRHLVEAGTLESINFFVTLLAVILIILLEQIASNKRVQAFLQSLLVFDRYTK